MEIDLRHSIAEGYKHSPDLRLAWLKELAELHSKSKRHAEAAQCYLHMVAMIAEYKIMVEVEAHLPQGCSAFTDISPNVDEESATSDDLVRPGDEVRTPGVVLLSMRGGGREGAGPRRMWGCSSARYSVLPSPHMWFARPLTRRPPFFFPFSPKGVCEDPCFSDDAKLLELMDTCISEYEKAGMYEHAIQVRKRQLPMLEHKRSYEMLQQVESQAYPSQRKKMGRPFQTIAERLCHPHSILALLQAHAKISASYGNILGAMAKGNRLLGTYYRVKFFGPKGRSRMGYYAQRVAWRLPADAYALLYALF